MRQAPGVGGGVNVSKYRGHSLTTIDGDTHYHEEWIKNKVYEKYIDYEEQEKKPMLHAASEAFKENQ